MADDSALRNRFQPGRLFRITKNGIHRLPHDIFRFRSTDGSIAQVLDVARTLLKLDGPPKLIFTDTGAPVSSLSQLPEGAVLVISCGEPFIQKSDPAHLANRLRMTISTPISSATEDARSASARGKPTDSAMIKSQADDSHSPAARGKAGNAVSVLFKPFADDARSTSTRGRAPDALSTISRMTAVTLSAQPRSRHARYHQLLAVLPGSMDEHIRDSLLATYATMDPEARAGLKDARVYEQVLFATQINLFSHQLVSQSICSVYPSSPIDSQISEWAFNLFEGTPIDTVQLAISEPRSSGKTTLLSKAVEVLYRKVQRSNEPDSYLIFPLNMELHHLYLDDPRQFYLAVIAILFDTIRYTRFELFPFWLQLPEWFLYAPWLGTMSKMPDGLDVLQRVDVDALANLGRSCQAAFHQSWVLAEFTDFIFSLPAQFAAALKMKSVVYVVDHFDLIDPDFAPPICAQLRKSLFLVAAQDHAALPARLQGEEGCAGVHRSRNQLHVHPSRETP
jgi:hypothetical protein